MLQADLARGVIEQQVEKALQRLVVDAEMAPSIRILSFFAARQESAEGPLPATKRAYPRPFPMRSFSH